MEKKEGEKQLRGRVLIDEIKCDLPLRLKLYRGLVEMIPHIISGIEHPKQTCWPDMDTYLETYLSGKKTDIKRELITTEQLLYERLHGNEQDKDRLRTTDITTGDALIEDPDGSGEIIIGRYENPEVKKLVNSINRANYDFENATLPISSEEYQDLKKNAYTISPKIVHELRQNPDSHPEATAEVLKYLVKNTALIQETKDFVNNYEYEHCRESDRRTLNLILPNYTCPGLQLLEIDDLISAYEIYPEVRERRDEHFRRYPHQRVESFYSSHSILRPRNLHDAKFTIGVAKKSSVIESIKSTLEKTVREAEQHYKL